MQNPRRDVAFDIQAVPRDWCEGDPFTTTFMASLSLLFPEGERFFVDSVKSNRRAVTPELAERVAGFIGQEAMHGREHRAFNALVGPAPRVDAFLRWLLGLGRTLPPRAQLAITCALEHFTAMLAEQMLDTPHIQAVIDPSVRPLWLWHALEESEHKAVAFDVYRAAGGGYALRVATMLYVSVLFVAVQTALHARLMAARGILWTPWRWLRPLARMWIWPGDFTRLAPRYLAYFKPSFHPDDRDNTGLVARWREALFGPTGALR